MGEIGRGARISMTDGVVVSRTTSPRDQTAHACPPRRRSFRPPRGPLGDGPAPAGADRVSNYVAEGRDIATTVTPTPR